MSDRQGQGSAREDRVGEAVAWYYQAAEAGDAPDPAELLARFPDLRAELESFLADKAAFDRAAGQPAPAPPDPDAPIPPAADNDTATLPPSPVRSATVPHAGTAADGPLGTVRYFGDYELLQEIARGGMGVVFRARQVSLNREVALKMILAGQLAGAADVARFRAEAEAAANLDHPNVLPIYEVGEHQGQQYFAMKFAPGGSLAGRVGVLVKDPRAAAAVFAKVCRAVDFAHRRGILHRDLKPGNVLLDDDGTPYVTDFGLAKKVDGDSGLTQTGAIVGTPSYMAPEQARAEKQLTTAADVYALGAILYELLTGRPPFRGPTVLDTVLQVLEREPDHPRTVNPAADRDLSVVALKCLEKDPARRYESAAAVADDLDRWGRGEPVSVSPATRTERLVKWVRRKPTLAAAYGLTAAALVLLALGAGAVWLWQQAEGARELAVAARAEAEGTRDQLAEEKGETEKARDELARTHDKLARVEYGRTINAVLQAWRDSNLAEARALLAGTRADLRGWEYHYARRLCHRNLVILTGHSAAFSPDATRVVTVGRHDPPVRVWDAATGKELVALRGHTGLVNRAAFSPDGTRVVTTGEDKTARVWDAATGKELAVLKGHAHAVTAVAFSPDGKRVATAEGVLTLFEPVPQAARVWDAATGEEVAALKGHTSFIDAVAFSPDGKKVVTGSRDGTARVWDATTGAHLVTLKGNQLRNPLAVLVPSAAFSPDGERVVTAEVEFSDKPIAQTAWVWDAGTGAKVATLQGHTGTFITAAFSPDGKKVVTAAGQTARVWDTATWKPVATLQGHTGTYITAAFSPDGNRVVTAGDDRTARVWDAVTGKEITVLRGHAGAITSATFSSDGKRVLTAGDDQTARVWDAGAEAEATVLRGHTEPVYWASFDPTGVRVVTTGGPDLTARVWDAATGDQLTVLKESAGYWLTSAIFSPDGKWLVTAGDGGVARVWDPATGKAVTALRDGQSAAFSPDGKRLVTASLGVVRVWDAATWRQVATFEEAGGVRQVAFSPDGTRVVTAGNFWEPHVWDADTGAQLTALKGHTGAVASAAFSPDGTRVVTAADDRTARVWDAASGRELAALGGHTGKLKAAVFSPHGKRVVTASEDKTARVWDAATGAELAVLRGHTGGVFRAAFSRDGRRIVTAGTVDHTARVWDATPAQAGDTEVPRAAPP